MRFGKAWSRRRFLAISSAAATQAAAGLKGLGRAPSQAAAAAQAANARETAANMPPPGVITGGTQPLMESMIARPLRYKPVAGEFVIRNGGEFFNRPIYGPPDSAGFRVDAGDKPEFSLYLPGHGGNLKLGFISADGKGSKWGAQADEVVARYRPGRMIYEIRDALLGEGAIHVELLTMGEGSGLMVKAQGQGVPAGARLAWAFGGVSGKKGRRGGDIGCEVEPVSRFFQVRAEECEGNQYAFRAHGERTRQFVQLSSSAASLALGFPAGSVLMTEPFEAWASIPVLASVRDSEPKQPVLAGSVQMTGSPLYLTAERLNSGAPTFLDSGQADPAEDFAKRSAEVVALAQSIKIDTPDEYINAAGPALAVAADALWDTKQGCLMHGAVAWRQAFAGYGGGPYALDALGTHERAATNFPPLDWPAKYAAGDNRRSSNGRIVGREQPHDAQGEAAALQWRT